MSAAIAAAAWASPTGEDGALFPDGGQVLTTSDDESARLWQVADGTLRWQAEGVGEWGTFSPDGRLLAINHHAGRTQLLQRQTGAVLRVLSHDGSLGGLHFLPTVVWPRRGFCAATTRKPRRCGRSKAAARSRCFGR